MSGAWPGAAMCLQALPTEGSRSPKASGHWKQSQDTGRGDSQQVCTLGLGREWGGEQEFHFHILSLWGSPQSGQEQVTVLEKGWGLTENSG